MVVISSDQKPAPYSGSPGRRPTEPTQDVSVIRKDLSLFDRWYAWMDGKIICFWSYETDIHNILNSTQTLTRSIIRRMEVLSFCTKFYRYHFLGIA